MEGENDHVDGRPLMAGNAGQRRIERPADPGAAADEHRAQQQQIGRDQEPEADVVEARKGHVGRADHQRHEPVAEPSEGRRHDREEHHHQPVRGDDDVVGLMIGDEVVVGMQQLRAHRDRQGAGDDPGADGEGQVERTDVLMIGGEQPTGDETRPAMGLVKMPVGGLNLRSVSHPDLFTQLLRASAATRTAPPSSALPANCFLAATSQRWKSALVSALISIGMKA